MDTNQTAPVSKSPEQIAARFVEHFGRKPGEFLPEFPKKGTDGLWRDSARRIFDPKRHQSANGVPLCGAQGNFLKIPSEGRTFASADSQAGGTDSQANAQRSQPLPSTETTPPPTSPPLRVPEGYAAPSSTIAGDGELVLAAEHLVSVEESTAMGVFGSDEWKLRPEEIDALKTAWVIAMQARGKINLPWWAPLVAVHVRISIPRLQMDKTKAKVKSWQEKFSGWFKRVRGVTG